MSTLPQQLGKYELRERLGRGGMAEVWKAYDNQLRRFVAIKILHADLQNDPSFITRFEREAQVIASLHHPNIVQIHDFHISRPPETESTIAYMVMDYVEGETLATYIRNTSRMGRFPSPANIVNLFTPICQAIDYAHQKGMIHRDIKPANILLDKRHTARNPMGEPILTDFGIVKMLGATSSSLSGTWLGTPLYTSPEQAMGHPGNERSDVYSLGVILYEICAGVQPFRGENISAIMMQHINTMPTPPALINPNIPPAVTLVILRCLTKDPAARFSSASAIATALAEAANMPVPGEPNSPVSPREGINEPISYSPLPQPNQQQGRTPSSPALPLAGTTPVGAQFIAPSQQSTPIPPPAGSFTPQSMPAGDWQGAPITPLINIPGGPSPANVESRFIDLSPNLQVPLTPPPQSLPALSPAPPPTPAPRRRRRGLFIALIALAILLLLGAGLSTLLLLTRGSPPPPAMSKVVGNIRFISTAKLYRNNNQGINDEVLIDLQNIPNPAAGKAYYAWLLGDTNQNAAVPPLLLNNQPLAVSKGEVHYTYPGDVQHSNLLLDYSRFLITEEDAQNTPGVPSFDYSAWRFAAAIPRVPDKSKFHFSLLDHLRHLLANENTILQVGLTGGLGIWFLRNTEEVLKWALAANDSTNLPFVRQQLVNILYYVDGQACIASDLQNAAPGTPQTPENATIAHIAHVAMLEPCAQAALGYVRHIGAHLLGLVNSVGATQQTRDAAAQIDKAMNDVKAWLGQERSDAIQLLDMPDAQLAQASALSTLGDLVTQARSAYAGHVDPTSGAYQGGVLWIYSNIQHLVIFDVTPCTSTTTACV